MRYVDKIVGLVFKIPLNLQQSSPVKIHSKPPDTRSRPVRQSERTQLESSQASERTVKQQKADARNDGKISRNSGKVKQAIVSKLSETIGENVNCFGIGMSLTLY